MKAVLIKNGLWDYVIGNVKRPVVNAENPISEAQAHDWDIEDRNARVDLILSISPSELKQIKTCRTSNEVWTKLRFVYDS